jgi:hypothetical protein
VKLTLAKNARREFNAWYVRTFSDPDHRFTHMPSWLKADLWLAWQAALEQSKEK